jgi:hypothetical protein
VRVLEAKFHPGSKTGQTSVVVGRILCDGPRAVIEPAPISAAAVAPFERASVYDKLESLVGSAVGDTFYALLALRSGYWSFAEAPGRDDQPKAA